MMTLILPSKKYRSFAGADESQVHSSEVAGKLAYLSSLLL
jgi:hypothetical protein